jgi:hypothetical protein
LNLPFNYFAAKIKEFLRHAKGQVPALETTSDHTIDIFAAIRSSSEDNDEADDDEVLEDLDEMQLDTGSNNNNRASTRRQRHNALKYMVQLQRVADRKQKGLVIDLQDVAEVREGEGNGPELHTVTA